MKKVLPALLFFMFVVLSGCKTEVNFSEEKIKDGVFVHISHGSDDIHRALMGLQMGVLMSESKDVLIYFDIKGIELVLQDAENYTYAQFPGSKTQIQKLISSNVTLMACPGCLKAAGKTEDDLMTGIEVADKDRFFDFTEGRILTIDY